MGASRDLNSGAMKWPKARRGLGIGFKHSNYGVYALGVSMASVLQIVRASG